MDAVQADVHERGRLAVAATTPAGRCFQRCCAAPLPVLQAMDKVKCGTQPEQLQLLNSVINSKDTLEALERQCGKDEAGGCLSG